MAISLTRSLATSILLLTGVPGRAEQPPMPGSGGAPRLTHPRMPGVRCAELWNRDWPRTLHDKQLTGFSPLTCNMKAAPRVWATLDVGGELSWTRQVTTRDGRTLLLLNDGRLRAVSEAGKVLWESGEWGAVVFFGDLRGNGRDYLMLGVGPRLSVVDTATGKTDWVHVFEPAHVYVRARVGDVLPERPGLEAAVFFQYGEEGCLLSFPPEGEPQFVWQRKVVVDGEHPERADHGCDIRLDLSVPERPMIWNIRHHRCRGFDVRTGDILSTLVYDIGGGHRRNYGPWDFGTGKGGRPLICVVGEAIQTHVHAIRLNRNGPSELAWQHYYGEVYVVPGVAVKNLAIADVDGDGETEMVYNVRDPEKDFRSFVRVRDADTGEIEVELADQWCAGTFTGVGSDGNNGLLVYPAPAGTTPDWGELTVLRFAGSGHVEPAGTVPTASTNAVTTMPGAEGNELLLRSTGGADDALSRYTLRGGKLTLLASTRAPALLEAPLRDVLRTAGGEPTFLVAGASGSLQGLTWEGKALWDVPLLGGPAATLSAADLDGDGKAELAATMPGNRAAVFALDESGHATQRFSREFHGARSRYSPLLFDLDGNGQLDLVAPGTTRDGKLVTRAYRPDGTLLWERALDMATAGGGTTVAWNAGAFLPGPQAGLAVSVGNANRTREGTYLLDGATGKILWFKDMYRDGTSIRGCVPVGLPSAFDVDGDGVEEVGMDMYSYLAYLRGTDGSFALLHHTRNIRAENALYAGLLYHSFSPVYRAETDDKPHWLISLGHGDLGLLNPDPTAGVWKEELGYDVPDRIGLVDVDGDGALEVGYTVRNSPVFKCRNLWTGEVKWELTLPGPIYGPVIAADVDGDGKGEFLGGSYCLGTNAEGKGELRWQSPVSLGWAIIADLDGDGFGELACASRGKIYVLKGTASVAEP